MTMNSGDDYVSHGTDAHRMSRKAISFLSKMSLQGRATGSVEAGRRQSSESLSAIRYARTVYVLGLLRHGRLGG